MAMSQRWLFALGMVTWLAGCGTDTPANTACPPVASPSAAAEAPIVAATPTPTPKATPKPKASTGTATKPGTSATPAPTASAPTASATPKAATVDPMTVLNDVKATTLGQTGMKGVISTYEMKADKSKFNNGTFSLSVSDKSYRLDCTAHSKANNVGSKTVLVYGQPNARVKPAGFLSIVTVTLALTDSNLISLNGITLDKILSHGVLERMTSGDYSAEAAGTTTIGADTVHVVKLKVKNGTNPLFADTDYEYVGYDDNKLYRMWALYAKPELGLPQNNLLYQVTVDQAQTGVTIPADTFNI